MRARARRTETGRIPARGPQSAIKSPETGPTPALGTLAAAARSGGTWAVRPAEVAVLQRQIGNQATAAILAPRKDAPAAPRPEAIQHAQGRPLDPPIRERLEAALGADLSAVRIHTDEPAHRSAASLGAKAYTIGSHIAFASGQFAPESADGLRLLAHEATHVLQQMAHRATGTDRGDGVQVSRPADPLEREADAAADAMALTPHSRAGALSHPARAGSVTPVTGTVVQRTVFTLSQGGSRDGRGRAEDLPTNRCDVMETGGMADCVSVIVLWNWNSEKGHYKKVRGFHGAGGFDAINFASLFQNVPDGTDTLIIACFGVMSSSVNSSDPEKVERYLMRRFPSSRLEAEMGGKNYQIDRMGNCTEID